MTAKPQVWQGRSEYSPAWGSQPPVAAEVMPAVSKPLVPLRETQEVRICMNIYSNLELSNRLSHFEEELFLWI